MIGIEFKKSNEHDNFLNYLFENIDLNDYEIDITEDEMYYDNQNIHFDKLYNEGKFKSGIYVIFINLKIYPKNNTNYENIKTYEDFINSSCQLMVLINDSVYVEIYFKDKLLKNKILSNVCKKRIKYDV